MTWYGLPHGHSSHPSKATLQRNCMPLRVGLVRALPGYPWPPHLDTSLHLLCLAGLASPPVRAPLERRAAPAFQEGQKQARALESLLAGRAELAEHWRRPRGSGTL